MVIGKADQSEITFLFSPNLQKNIFKILFFRYSTQNILYFFVKMGKKTGFIFIYLSFNERISEKPQFPCQNSSIDSLQAGILSIQL